MYSMKDKFFNHFTGFSSYTDCSNVLNFVLPDLDRKRLVYWGTSQAKASYSNTEKLLLIQKVMIQMQTMMVTFSH